MKKDLHQMTITELKQYISEHRTNEEAFSAALEEIMKRRDPNSPYYPCPSDLANPMSEIEAIFKEKLSLTD